MDMIMMQHIGTVRANMRIDKDGNNVTDVVVDGIVIKTHQTQKSQIRAPRESLLWKMDHSVDFEKIEDETERRLEYHNDLDARDKQGLHNSKRGTAKVNSASKIWNHQTS